jgi:hypothetical protein
MRQRNIIPVVMFLAILMLVLPVVATEEMPDDTDVSLPDLRVSNPRYYSADSDRPVIGTPSGIRFDITNIGTTLFHGETIVWFSSDRYFSDTLPLNVNNIVEMRSSYYIVPGQTITVALANYRPWGELNKPGVDYLDFGVKTYAPEEDKTNNNGEFKFVVKSK